MKSPRKQSYHTANEDRGWQSAQAQDSQKIPRTKFNHVETWRSGYETGGCVLLYMSLFRRLISPY